MRPLLYAALIAGIAFSCSGPTREVLTEPIDNCEPTATRCNNGVFEVCASDQRWMPSINCTETGFVCCEVPDGHTCLPECAPPSD